MSPRKEFGIGTPDVGPNLVDNELSRSVTPALSEAPDMTESALQYDQAELEAYASLSKMSRKLPLSPVVSLDPSVAVSLPNGDLYYKLTTRVNLAEKFIGSSIAMTVELSLKDEPMDVSSLLSRLTPMTLNSQPPTLAAHTIFSLVDPLKVRYQHCSASPFTCTRRVGIFMMIKVLLYSSLMTCNPILLLILKQPPSCTLFSYSELSTTRRKTDMVTFLFVSVCPKRSASPRLLRTWINS